MYLSKQKKSISETRLAQERIHPLLTNKATNFLKKGYNQTELYLSYNLEPAWKQCTEKNEVA